MSTVNPFLPNWSSEHCAGPRTPGSLRLEGVWRSAASLFVTDPRRRRKEASLIGKAHRVPLSAQHACTLISSSATNPSASYSARTHPAIVENIPENMYVRVSAVHASEAVLRWTLVCSHCSAILGPHRCRCLVEARVHGGAGPRLECMRERPFSFINNNEL